MNNWRLNMTFFVVIMPIFALVASNCFALGKDLSVPKACIEKEIAQRMVFLKIDQGHDSITYCSGVLIDGTTIATAGHCFIENEFRDFVRMGFKNQIQGNEVDKVKSIRLIGSDVDLTAIRLSYFYSKGADKAIIRLKQSINLKSLNWVDVADLQSDEVLISAGFAGHYDQPSYFEGRSNFVGPRIVVANDQENEGFVEHGDSGGPSFRAIGCNLEIAGIITRIEPFGALGVTPIKAFEDILN